MSIPAHGMKADILPNVGEMAFGAGLMSVQMGNSVVRLVAVWMGVSGVQRSGVADAAAAGIQVVTVAADMAGIAAHGVVVRPVQRVKGMIIARPLPGRGVVALPAVAVDPGVKMVWIPAAAQVVDMATFAVDRGVTVVSPGMAALAVCTAVAAIKDKAGLDVTEGRRQPAGRGVTVVTAAGAELVAMGIPMAGGAVVVETDKPAGAMALVAAQAGVASFQREGPLAVYA